MTIPELLLKDSKLAELLNALVASGTLSEDPRDRVVRECTARVAAYIGTRAIDPDHRNRLIRPLALVDLYTLAGEVPDGIKSAGENAEKELEAIRDGKFDPSESGGAVDTGTTDTVGQVTSAAAWGSKAPIFP